MAGTSKGIHSKMKFSMGDSSGRDQKDTQMLQNNWYVIHTNARTKHNLIRIFPINTIQYKTSQKITHTQKTDEATFIEDT